MAVSFGGSMLESLLPDPCPSDCAQVVSATFAGAAIAEHASPARDTSAPASPAACHCAHSHITRAAFALDVPRVRVTLVATPAHTAPRAVAGLEPIAPPVPPPLG